MEVSSQHNTMPALSPVEKNGTTIHEEIDFTAILSRCQQYKLTSIVKPK
jgi:hypothetical protein